MIYQYFFYHVSILAVSQKAALSHGIDLYTGIQDLFLLQNDFSIIALQNKLLASTLWDSKMVITLHSINLDEQRAQIGFLLLGKKITICYVFYNRPLSNYIRFPHIVNVHGAHKLILYSILVFSFILRSWQTEHQLVDHYISPLNQVFTFRVVRDAGDFDAFASFNLVRGQYVKSRLLAMRYYSRKSKPVCVMQLVRPICPHQLDSIQSSYPFNPFNSTRTFSKSIPSQTNHLKISASSAQGDPPVLTVHVSSI